MQRQINSILRLRQSDPPGLNKGDSSKNWCYETIEQVFSSGMMHDFGKFLKKSYEIETSDFNQLAFPINHMMFIFARYQLIDKFEDKEEYKRLKLRFHAILGNKEEVVWSLVKMVKVLNISRESLFENLL